MARCIATHRGWDGKRIIEPGETFDFDGPKGSWFDVVDEEEAGAGSKGGGEGGGLDRDQIKAALDALKVTYNARAGTEALQKLLDASLAKA